MESIVLARIEDVPIIQKVAKKVWYATYEPILGYAQTHFMFQTLYNEEELIRLINTNEQEFWLLKLDEDVLGFAGISKVESSKWKLNKLYVNPTIQGSGYGKKLLVSVEEILKEKQVKTLTLNVNRFNTALRFYKNMGYCVTTRVDIPFGDYFMNDYVMEKTI